MYAGKKIHLIAAMDERRVIGRVIGGKYELPWNSISEDMMHFRETTTPYPAIMGRVTWETIPEKFRPLKDRQNIILSKDPNFHSPQIGVIVANNLETAIAAANKSPVFIIGGGKIYAEAMKYADTMDLTIIHRIFWGNILFPEYTTSEWRVASQKSISVRIEGASTNISFIRYIRIQTQTVAAS
jgi:dihydrofolate reductase